MTLKILQPYIVLQGFFIILFVLESIFSRNPGPIVASIIQIYFWVCIYSLYEKIKIETRISAARLDLERTIFDVKNVDKLVTNIWENILFIVEILLEIRGCFCWSGVQNFLPPREKISLLVFLK